VVVLRPVEYTGRARGSAIRCARAALPPSGRAGNMKQRRRICTSHWEFWLPDFSLRLPAFAQGSAGRNLQAGIHKSRDRRQAPRRQDQASARIPDDHAEVLRRLLHPAGPQIRHLGRGQAALWESLTAFAGLYRIEGKKIVISPDVSYNEIFNGTHQTRDLEVNGRGITLSSGPRPYGRDPSKKIVLRQEWERIESVNCHPM